MHRGARAGSAMSSAKRSRSVALLVVLCLVVPATPAHARQMRVRDEPKIVGETDTLDLVSRRCGRQEKKYGGAVIAVARSCLYFYEFDSSDESDASSDYGIVWLQTSLNPADGWCALKVNSNVRLHEEVTPYEDATAPAEALTTESKQEVAVMLMTTARDNSESEAGVEQSFILYPKSATPILKEIEKTPQDDRLFRLQWQGSSGRTLAFASGIEISWNALEGRPASFPFSVLFELAKKRRC